MVLPIKIAKYLHTYILKSLRNHEYHYHSMNSGRVRCMGIANQLLWYMFEIIA